MIAHHETEKCTWLVQATVRGSTLQRLESACAANGNAFHRVNVIPFSESMPADMPLLEGPFVFYGYTTLLLNAFRDERWRRGVFFDPAVFRPSVYLENWGSGRMLNNDAKLTTMAEFAESAASAPDARWFVKPDDDLKRFTGGVMTYTEYLDWYSGVAELGASGDIGPDTQILVCRPKSIGHEWRLFIVDGRIVTKSCYTSNGRDLSVSPELEEFAISAAAEWSPAAAFALDVTIDDRGNPKIVEANCLNGSGLYFADERALVRAVSRWQELNGSA